MRNQLPYVKSGPASQKVRIYLTTDFNERILSNQTLELILTFVVKQDPAHSFAFQNSAIVFKIPDLSHFYCLINNISSTLSGCCKNRSCERYTFSLPLKISYSKPLTSVTFATYRVFHLRMGLSPGNSSPARSLNDPVSISNARLLEF